METTFNRMSDPMERLLGSDFNEIAILWTFISQLYPLGPSLGPYIGNTSGIYAKGI